MDPNVLFSAPSASNGGSRKNATLICAPTMAESLEKMKIDVSNAKDTGADVVEIRLDALNTFDPSQDLNTLLQHRPLPLLFTYRPKWEGGKYDGDENKRLDALRLAMELGADYIDVELQVAHQFFDSIRGKSFKTKVIVSSHNYQLTPSVEDLGNLVARIQATGADIVKIATTALDITDVARMFQIMVHSQVRRVPFIGLVMGDRGLISRILCAKFGGYLTFGTLESGVISAPGQPTLKDLLYLYNLRQLGPDTKVYGLIGKPVGHSKSPKLFNEAFKSVGIDGVYLFLLVDDPANFLRAYSSTDFVGFSVTIPHKETALKCCDEVDPVAKSIGAVNCVIRRPTDGKLIGYNTDYVGAISAIEDGLRGKQNGSSTAVSPLAGKLFVVIGAGGAGKALAYGAKEKGARVVIANRTYDRARELADIIGGDALALADLGNYHPEDDMILANTTSIGMQPKVDETPISKSALKYYSLVFDAIYTPKMTRLLNEAEESGATIVTGFEMFLGQAYGQYENFTGLPAPKELFRRIVNYGKLLRSDRLSLHHNPRIRMVSTICICLHCL
ncbi:bifunctional 3-dehydroquinate dehydratase/shikimate dehydrogenase, chloroplastic isoform X2 [Cajanus cajan]|uniref:bifunctional 3-dehydroquinate dehydratase/shikimate dehydrogenase, chloroplastic isoform X2 n=1 Tax=Cajanus cajan TaxID=3821 RepID=UPI00098DACEE|nr:bifunctional 3-dehydroquinate dehydratase/shikimate dehydrogenase, chloroplastic isoform X2 [Cajanus cajan]